MLWACYYWIRFAPYVMLPKHSEEGDAIIHWSPPVHPPSDLPESMSQFSGKFQMAHHLRLVFFWLLSGNWLGISLRQSLFVSGSLLLRQRLLMAYTSWTRSHRTTITNYTRFPFLARQTGAWGGLKFFWAIKWWNSGFLWNASVWFYSLQKQYSKHLREHDRASSTHWLIKSAWLQ